MYSNQEKQETELEQMKRKLQGAEVAQDFMKKANAFTRKKDDQGLEDLFKDMYGPEKYQAALAEYRKPDYMGKIGFASYQLSNNLANIKRMRGRVAELEAKAKAADEVGFKEQEFNGLTVVKNFTEDRLQLLFDGKPDDEVRKVLKSNGFRWAPSQQAWQRKLTNNALYALRKYVLNQPAFEQFK